MLPKKRDNRKSIRLRKGSIGLEMMMSAPSSTSDVVVYPVLIQVVAALFVLERVANKNLSELTFKIDDWNRLKAIADGLVLWGEIDSAVFDKHNSQPGSLGIGYWIAGRLNINPMRMHLLSKKCPYGHVFYSVMRDACRTSLSIEYFTRLGVRYIDQPTENFITFLKEILVNVNLVASESGYCQGDKPL